MPPASNVVVLADLMKLNCSGGTNGNSLWSVNGLDIATASQCKE